MCGCAQVLSQGFKQHLGWCKGTRQEAQDRRGSEGGEDVEAEDVEDEGDPQELAAIDASKVLICPISSLAQEEVALLQDDLHQNTTHSRRRPYRVGLSGRPPQEGSSSIRALNVD